MSDEISILTHISEENPTAASSSAVAEISFLAVNQRFHAIPDRALTSFTGLRSAVYNAASVPMTRRASCRTSTSWIQSAHIVPQRNFANAKTAFITVTTTAVFSSLITARAPSAQYSRSTVVNGGNDFNTKFGNSNSADISRRLPEADGRDGKRASS
ncbi:hypothetical protein Dda3937_04604 [Dickeya dadantii 3937]|uniref:Uncharacterized protein n=1 Tax=Dickeya dadantii (strain 3937) TaxID=198628 RepID=E0SF15_DICD3|nr:hypothetical protein [Dickeya dadantii]ADM98757.1 hypothetical protein Dda3937_04604 [Dickeya dadantii 3937]